MDMARNPEFAKALLNKVTDTIVGLLRLALQAGGQFFDMVELPGDDYASNNGMLMSPAMFRTYLLPCIEREVKVIKEYNPDLKIMFHSDGAIAGLIPDLIALGIDVIHPLQPLPATDMTAVKQEYGAQISFLGGIDIFRAMTGTLAEVVEEVKLRISQLATGGGYILAPSNHLQADVPAQNVIMLFKSAHELGKYPIQLG
jgi:uroporphyrinogen decarboxylase